MSASGIPDNQIWYTTNDDNIIEPILKPSTGEITADYGFGSVIMSNQYYDKGIIKTAGNVTQIGVRAFNGKTSLVSITLPSQVAVIYDIAFEGCTSLSQIDLKNVTTIGPGAFEGCTSLSQIDLKNVTTIGSGAFEGCTSLTSITIPDGVTSIEVGVFRDCTSLTSVTIPNSVTSIGYEAFWACSSLTSVYCKPIIPPSGDGFMFSSNASGRKIYVPMESVDAYKSASYWRNYASYIEGYDF